MADPNTIKFRCLGVEKVEVVRDNGREDECIPVRVLKNLNKTENKKSIRLS